jgi:hypothetical protein
MSNVVGSVALHGEAAGAKPYTMKVVRTVFNGGDEETGLVRPRLVATQLESAIYDLCAIFDPKYTPLLIPRSVWNPVEISGMT